MCALHGLHTRVQAGRKALKLTCTMTHANALQAGRKSIRLDVFVVVFAVRHNLLSAARHCAAHRVPANAGSQQPSELHGAAPGGNLDQKGHLDQLVLRDQLVCTGRHPVPVLSRTS